MGPASRTRVDLGTPYAISGHRNTEAASPARPSPSPGRIAGYPDFKGQRTHQQAQDGVTEGSWQNSLMGPTTRNVAGNRARSRVSTFSTTTTTTRKGHQGGDEYGRIGVIPECNCHPRQVWDSGWSYIYINIPGRRDRGQLQRYGELLSPHMDPQWCQLEACGRHIKHWHSQSLQLHWDLHWLLDMRPQDNLSRRNDCSGVPSSSSACRRHMAIEPNLGSQIRDEALCGILKKAFPVGRITGLVTFVVGTCSNSIRLRNDTIPDEMWQDVLPFSNDAEAHGKHLMGRRFSACRRHAVQQGNVPDNGKRRGISKMPSPVGRIVSILGGLCMVQSLGIQAMRE